MAKKVLVTLCNEAYVDAAKALFASASFDGGWDGDYLLLAHELSADNKAWFSERGVEIWDCPPLSDKVYQNWNPAFLSKLYLFDVRIKKWDNVVYLDADCMVRASFKKLAEVQGFKARKIMKTFGRNEPILTFTPQSHFNTGVMAFSTNIVQDDTFNTLKNWIPEVIATIKNNEHFIVTDEIIIARYFKKLWRNLALVYHVIPSQVKTFCFIPSEKVKGIILHHAHNSKEYPKPWIVGGPFYDEWKENFNKVEDFDANNAVVNASQWSTLSIRSYSIKYSFRSTVLYPLYLYWHRVLGIAGVGVKKMSPAFYFILRGYFKNEK